MCNGQRLYSPGWHQLKRPVIQLAAVGDVRGLLAAGAPPATDRTAGPVWDASIELVINLELARVQAPRYWRSYVAVWIEDKDKFPVRTLALWFQKPKWLPDLKT